MNRPIAREFLFALSILSHFEIEIPLTAVDHIPHPMKDVPFTGVAASAALGKEHAVEVADGAPFPYKAGVRSLLGLLPRLMGVCGCVCVEICIGVDTAPPTCV
jgi:hypothetical protein